MIEKRILNYLINSNIPEIGNKIFCEVPKDKESQYVIIEKLASGRQDRLNRANIAVQSISTQSLFNAANFNETIKEKMLMMPESEDIFEVKLVTDYNFTNAETEEYRYQAVFDIYYI